MKSFWVMMLLFPFLLAGCTSKQPTSSTADTSTEVQTQADNETVKADSFAQISQETKPAGNDFAEVEIEDSLDSETETVDLSENIEMPVQVSYAGEEPLEYRDLDYDTVILEESDYQVQIVFTAEQNVHDFHIYRLSFNDVDSEGNPVFETEQIYAQEELSRERPLQAVLTFPGDMPTAGFSYVRQDGQECRFSIGQSGKDGSLITSPF